MANGGWRSLVAGTIEADVARERANPIKNVFGTLVREAMELRKTKATEARAEAMQIRGEERAEETQIRAEPRAEATYGRGQARAAAYARYPQLAAKELGLEAPTTAVPAGTPEMPLYRVEYDESGQPKYVFQAPDQLDEKALVKMYNDYVTEVRKTNATNSWMVGRKGFKQYQPIPVPTYTEWLQELFPESSGIEIPAITGKVKFSDWFKENPKYADTPKNRELLKKANPNTFE